VANGFVPGFMLIILQSAAEVSNWKLFLIFLKVGAILYGSGYVLFAFLDAELVVKGLLSRQELIDAIAVGQFTPGPVFSAATFIGWQIGGWWGALAATIGIFLPSFLFVGLLNPLIPRLRKSKVMSAFLDTVNVVSIAIILAVAVEMGRETFLDWRTIVIAVLGFVLTFYFKKLNTAFVVLGGAALGYVLSLF
jgi:chromate transporter